MVVHVILPTFGKSRKTTKSDPSTGDQLRKREFLFKPVSTKFRAVPCRAVPCRAVPCRADRWVNGGSNKEPLI